MRKFILPIGLSVFLMACGGESQEKQTVTTEHVKSTNSALENYDKVIGGPAFKFVNESFNFGTITEGEVVEHSFQFVNSGDEELVIASASGSCGCTVPEWPKQPIAPGEKGIIKVTFNSKGKRNYQDKTVTLRSNAKGEQSTVRLHIIGDVTVAENN